MASTSSKVSVGRPIIKYSLILVQPSVKATFTVWSSSSSDTFLLITSRIRWLPASGAKVRPLFLTEWMRSISSGEKLSTRRLGRERLTFSSSVHWCRVSMSSLSFP